MSIKIFCLEKGKTPAVQHAFPVNISREETVGDLKKLIKAEKSVDFARVDPNNLRLWKVDISIDDDTVIQAQTLLQDNQLPVADEIEELWTDTPKRRHIHVIVEVPTGN